MERRSLLLCLRDYCVIKNMSFREFADREKIHMRSLRGFCKGYHIDDVTHFRIQFGIGIMSQECFKRIMVLYKKDKKYASLIELKRN